MMCALWRMPSRVGTPSRRRSSASVVLHRTTERATVSSDGLGDVAGGATVCAHPAISRTRSDKPTTAKWSDRPHNIIGTVYSTHRERRPPTYLRHSSLNAGARDAQFQVTTVMSPIIGGPEFPPGS